MNNETRSLWWLLAVGVVLLLPTQARGLTLAAADSTPARTTTVRAHLSLVEPLALSSIGGGAGDAAYLGNTSRGLGWDSGGVFVMQLLGGILSGAVLEVVGYGLGVLLYFVGGDAAGGVGAIVGSGIGAVLGAALGVYGIGEWLGRRGRAMTWTFLGALASATLFAVTMGVALATDFASDDLFLVYLFGLPAVATAGGLLGYWLTPNRGGDAVGSVQVSPLLAPLRDGAVLGLVARF